jgi:membrane-bound lytic murein transglycosylase A
MLAFSSKSISKRPFLRLIASLALLALAISGCGTIREFLSPERDRLVLEESEFTALPGWGKNNMAGALPAFRKSCERLQGLPGNRKLGGRVVGGRVADWRAVCTAATELKDTGADDTRHFFETWFEPFRATNNGEPMGLFTGYYEPVLRGSRRRNGPFTVPLYRRPTDLVTADLGLFHKRLEGRRIVGKVGNGELRPYPNRAAINAGALEGRGLEIAWVKDAAAAFFLHIQGSGQIVLKDGSIMRVGYAAQNGRVYHSIGRELIRRGILPREAVSLQSIRAWMKDNPGEARGLMEKNPSYIFFREIEGDGPIGAQGAVLTPLRSLAVDRRFIPLGVPLWVNTATPGKNPDDAVRPLRRLFIAQDTGGAIRGPVRGDIFWGSGPKAEAAAGRMNREGEYYLLLPRSLDTIGLPAM